MQDRQHPELKINNPTIAATDLFAIYPILDNGSGLQKIQPSVSFDSSNPVKIYKEPAFQETVKNGQRLADNQVLADLLDGEPSTEKLFLEHISNIHQAEYLKEAGFRVNTPTALLYEQSELTEPTRALSTRKMTIEERLELDEIRADANRFASRIDDAIATTPTPDMPY